MADEQKYFKHESPGWKEEGTEPLEELKDKRFSAGYKPPAGFFNWFWTRVSRCITELQDKVKGHASDKGNPHGVTAAQIDAATTTKVEGHITDTKNPHSVTFAQVGAAKLEDFTKHTNNKNNPHGITATLLGVPTVSQFNELQTQTNSKISSPVEIPRNANLNDYIEPGMYYCPQNAIVETLSFSPTPNAFSLLVEQHAGVHQKLVEYVSNGFKIFVRNHYSTSSWGPWRKVFTGHDLPTWSEIAGKPSSYQPASHSHSASEIGWGTLATARGGTGRTNGTVSQADSAQKATSSQFYIGTSYIHQYGAQQVGIFGPGGSSQSQGLVVGVVDGRWGVFPMGDDKSLLGGSQRRWHQIFSNHGVVTTSDKKQKLNISSIDTNFAIRLVKFLDAHNYNLRGIEQEYLHAGYIAQEVEEFLEDENVDLKDFAALIKSPTHKEKHDTLAVSTEQNEEEFSYGLQYEELNIYYQVVVKNLLERVEALEAELQKMKKPKA